MIDVIIKDKVYSLQEARTAEEHQKGLMGVEELPKDEGMIFYYDFPQKVDMWMQNTKIPLDIIFVDDDLKVIKVREGKPMDETLISCDDVSYVIELNAGSGVRAGDEVEFDNKVNFVLKVLAPDGSVQMDLEGGERIVSRRETKIIIQKAYKAYKSQNDNHFKSLGRYLMKVFKKQDEREPDFVKK